jgi:hypothetical protein
MNSFGTAKDNYKTNQGIVDAISELEKTGDTSINLIQENVKITTGLTNDTMHHNQAGGNMYNKYLKYKNKYASLKKSSEI